MFLSSKLICSSLPFSFYLSHSVCLSVTLYILTHISMLFCLNICAKPIKMDIVWMDFKAKQKMKKMFSERAINNGKDFQYQFQFFDRKTKINEFQFYYIEYNQRQSFVVKTKNEKKQKQNRGRPKWNLKEKSSRELFHPKYMFPHLISISLLFTSIFILFLTIFSLPQAHID